MHVCIRYIMYLYIRYIITKAVELGALYACMHTLHNVALHTLHNNESCRARSTVCMYACIQVCESECMCVCVCMHYACMYACVELGALYACMHVFRYASRCANKHMCKKSERKTKLYIRYIMCL
jgi:hypothetical protein